MTHGSAPIAYDFAVLRLIPRVHRHDQLAVGVVVHARTEGYLAARVVTDADRIAARAPTVDVPRVIRYLETLRAVAAGDPAGGPMALLPPSERFHWLTAPRSDLLQCSPVHPGLTHDPALTLDQLFESYVDP